MAEQKSDAQNENNEELDDDLELEEYINKEQILIKTHDKIDADLCGVVEHIEVGYVEVLLKTTTAMLADSQGLIHGGFIFGAADYAAMIAINEPNVVLVASNCQFLSPVKLGDIVTIKATVRHKEGRKRNVFVEAFAYDVKVFEGEFKTVVTEHHILKLDLIKEVEKVDD